MSKQITNHWSFTLFSSLLSSSLCCMQHQNSRLSHTHSKLKGPGGIRHSCDRRWKEGIIIMILSIMIEFILSLSMEIALFSIFASSVIFFCSMPFFSGGFKDTGCAKYKGIWHTLYDIGEWIKGHFFIHYTFVYLTCCVMFISSGVLYVFIYSYWSICTCTEYRVS